MEDGDDSVDQFVQDFLFTCQTWQGFAKLRMHVDATLDRFEKWTAELGESFRGLEELNDRFDTKELPKEQGARMRRKTKNITKKSSGKGPKRVKFNNSTAKTHLLGDFPWCIKYFGTSDSYDTRIVCTFFCMSLVQK